MKTPLNRLHSRAIVIEIEREDDGRWIAEVPELPGVMAYGQTQEEAVSRVGALADAVERTAQQKDGLK